MNSMAKFVVSTTLGEAEWNNSTVIRGGVAEEVSKLKRAPGKDILVAGSRTLVQTLVQHDLVDQYRLMVFPIILGAGKRLFPDANTAHALSLVESKTVGAGVLTLIYESAPRRNSV